VTDDPPAKTGTFAAVSCVECGRSPQPGERWRLHFADIGSVVVYCPACAKAGVRPPSEMPDQATRDSRLALDHAQPSGVATGDNEVGAGSAGVADAERA
jgi:hypothetical protein